MHRLLIDPGAPARWDGPDGYADHPVLALSGDVHRVFSGPCLRR